jgi:hypothetical protein
MTERYGYGYGENDLPGSRRGPGVTGQRADEADPPERPADVREIDLTEDDPDEHEESDEQVERLRKAASEQDDDGQVQARSPFRLGPPVRAHQDDDEDEGSAAGEAPEAGAATVDISVPPGDGDEAPALAAAVDRVDAGEPAAAEPVGEAGPGGVTLAPATPLPRSERGGEAAAGQGAAAPVAPAGAAPASRSGALLATDAEAIRRQFIGIQAGFVDEPRQAVEQAGELVEELHRKVMASLQAERVQLDEAVDDQEPSTEDLRQALRAYRAYVDRLLGLSL